MGGKSRFIRSAVCNLQESLCAISHWFLVGLLPGILVGALAILIIFNQLGVFELRTNPLILVPVLTKPAPNVLPYPTLNSPTPSNIPLLMVPTPSPTPVPTRTIDEKMFEGGAVHAKKKKTPEHDGFDKWGDWTDLNRDGVVERSFRMYHVKAGEGQFQPFATGFRHGCCDCALVHYVSVQTSLDEFGFPALVFRWTRLQPETDQGRIRKWGPAWWEKGRNFFDNFPPGMGDVDRFNTWDR